MKSKPLLSIPALLFAVQVHAACEAPGPGAMPDVPDGNQATADEMFAAQEQVEAYVASIKAYLDCRHGRLANPVHNGLVIRAESLANDYNTELRKHRSKQSEIAVK